jgi:hypothetical protein
VAASESRRAGTDVGPFRAVAGVPCVGLAGVGAEAASGVAVEAVRGDDGVVAPAAPQRVGPLVVDQGVVASLAVQVVVAGPAVDGLDAPSGCPQADDHGGAITTETKEKPGAKAPRSYLDV